MKGLVKKFPGFQLGPIDLEIPAGSACGLLGPNGAGKTTLLNCLAGQLTPDRGEALWSGSRVSRDNWTLRESIAFVPEQPKLYDGLTVEQTLRFCSAIFQFWDREFVSKWLVKFGLPLKKRVRVLSKGLTVKLHLLIGLAHSARLLLLDEPTAGLDPESRVELQEHIRALINDREVCALISSHLFQDIEAIATEFRIIRSGELVFGSALEEIRDMRIYRASSFDVPALSGESRRLLKSWTKDGEHFLLVHEPQPREPLPEDDWMCEKPDLERIYFLTREDGS